MHWDIKSSLISPSLQSVNPNGAMRSHVAHRYLTGFNRDILETRRCGAELRGEHSCPRLRENGGLIEGTNGTSASQTTQQTNATAEKHFSGLVLGYIALFLWGVCDRWDALGRWDYTQHVVDVRGCDLIKKNITHIKRSVSNIKYIMASRKNTLNTSCLLYSIIVKSYLIFFIIK